MKKVTLFYLASCPYCKKAISFLDDLLATEEYHDIEIEKIEESREAETANSYDYYYVPTFYLGKEKLHEGACEKEDVEKVLQAALNA